jgi:histidinol-phosphate/aromatic aminotransferase/cobyric acid decarboxylase-like protein
LQIINKYQKDYRDSCKNIAAERTRFKTALERTGLLRVYPSQANYFLCELTNGMSARRLAEDLLQFQDVFIKDLTGKKGVPGDSFIRLAVRDRADDDTLVTRLGQIDV